MKAIIEHLEEELYEWCLLEYAHISHRIGKENLIFTNVKRRDHDLMQKLGHVREESIIHISKEDPLIKKATLCLLDPNAKSDLSPDDKGKIDFFVFGGILGDHPMKGRTQLHFNQLTGAKRRRLGDQQMSTDTAVIVCKKIIDEGIPLQDLTFQDGIELLFTQEKSPGNDSQEEGASQIFPYRYLIEDNKLVLTPGLIEYLQREFQ